MSENCLSAVEINQDLCGRCTICYSICPFQAIDRDASTGNFEINIQKCQVCGLCYSACPAGAINIAYYDNNSLIDYVESAMEQTKADTLVITCRGNSPSGLEVDDLLSAQRVGVDRYIPLRVPCAGRLPISFIFRALVLGIKRIISIQCEDKFCRMKAGSKIESHRLILGKMLLEQLGYPEDAIKVMKYSRKAMWENDKCVGCDKCAFICPYGAIDLEPFSSPTINRNECVGCGACQLVCPHHAIQLSGFEFDRIHASYCEAAKLMKGRNNEPVILVFSCQWSDYSVLDNPQKILEGRNAAVLEVPCFKGMDPVHVVNSFLNGFDGVMGVICSESDCKLHEGRDVADRQLDVLRRVLERLGLENRFEIFELSPRCQGELQEKYEAFAKKIGQMPQLLAREEVTKCTE